VLQGGVLGRERGTGSTSAPASIRPGPWRGWSAGDAPKAGGRIVNVAARQALEPPLAALSAALDTPTNRRDMPKANFDAWPKVKEVAAILFLASRENKVSRGGVVLVFGASFLSIGGDHRDAIN
jgi:hypothetical protein